jgi:hypothetical protein
MKVNINNPYQPVSIAVWVKACLFTHRMGHFLPHIFNIIFRQCAASIYRNVGELVWIRQNLTQPPLMPSWRQVAVDVYTLPSTSLR